MSTARVQVPGPEVLLPRFALLRHGTRTEILVATFTSRDDERHWLDGGYRVDERYRFDNCYGLGKTAARVLPSR